MLTSGVILGYLVNHCQQPIRNKMLSIEEIRERLEDRNLAAVARKMNCTRSYLHYVRTGKQTPKDTDLLVRLSNYLEGKK